MALTATLHIETALRRGKTVLQRSFCNPPFKIADITEDKSSHTLRLMLMSSSPGVLDGDEYRLHIAVAAQCCLALTTQSYQRLFRMEKGAVQHFVVEVQQGGFFTYLPQPLVPHKGAVYKATNRIYLSGGCILVWGEVISCGRKLNGEVFQFSLLHNLTEVFLSGKLVIRENLLLRPAETDLAAIGQLEGYTHQATLILLNEHAATGELTEVFLNTLNEQGGIAFGVSALPVNGLMVRLLGHKAEQLFALLKQIAALFEAAVRSAPVKLETYVV